MTNYYEILGVSPKASTGEIKAAFRKLSKKFHPDLNGNDPYFESMFIKVQKAYEVLQNPEMRARYDRLLAGETYTPAPVSREVEIVHFRTDKLEIRSGEVFTVFWQTKNADQVFIKPFGIMSETSGQRAYKLTNFYSRQAELILVARNKKQRTRTTSRLVIFNSNYNPILGMFTYNYWNRRGRFILMVFTVLFLLYHMAKAVINGAEEREKLRELERQRWEQYQRSKH